ncbi:nuclease Fan1 [Pseudoduganella ginsengisoli]|uniref:phosphodiesterase I n=1 Tax=Pseudoduganella ginsengisoli TaxID=1462440 RepID=A0A6L6Q5W0_9BURK|nr:VRR-NUC domain-containing protein [Pseudoduganella ginsengisoli]MTW04522.1 VRR-NUC domain-containing protein [Pseudoduganella ginsengisoli]
MVKVLENPFYYLDNFQQVLQWIAARYDDLLDDAERSFVAQFAALPQPSRALFVRMAMRKGVLFRASKLVYPEIGNTTAAAAPLTELGWIAAGAALALDDVFAVLQKPELAQLFAFKGADKTARKADQLEALRERYPDALPLSGWAELTGGIAPSDTLYHMLMQPLCDRLRLVFFGNFHQDWSEFVLSDLGIYQYEKVDFPPSARGFRTRADIDAYLALHACRERFAHGEPALDILRDLPPDDGNEWLASRRHRLQFQMAQQQEKLQDWPGALALYRDCPYPGARARAIRVLEKSEAPADAYALLEQAMASPESDAERQQLLRMAPRLRRKLGHPKQPATPAAPVVRLDLALPMPPDDWWVEGVVRDHLSAEASPVYYVENALANSLFGLLCWDAIFTPIPGAFFHPFHHGPADLHAADFHARRAAPFAACLAQLDDGSYADTIRRNFAAKFNIQSPFVYWGALDETLLELALACIPAPHLKLWCERILADIQSNRSGFPDLIQFWPDERRYHMIEVKGPGDRLQDNQLRWIAYCAQHAMPITVCYLQWAA